MRAGKTVVRCAMLLSAAVGLAVPAAAQLWVGPAAVEIRAEDHQGRPAAGAEVRMEYRALEPPGGPSPVRTDERGRAVVGPLAEGLWHLEVSREGFMTYVAEIEVRRDGRPELVTAAQHNVPGAVHSMRVRLSRSREVPRAPQIAAAAPAPPPAAPASPQPTAPSTPRPSAPPPAPPAAPAPAAPAPAPQPSPAPPAATAPRPSPPPTPPPSSTPAPAAERPAAPPTPQETPPPAPSAPRPAAPPAERPPAPAPAQPTPAPPPAPAPQAPPAPAPAPAASAAPAPAPATPAPSPSPVRHRSFEDRTCFECKPGEASLSVEAVVGPGLGCGTGVRELLDGAVASGVPASLPAGCSVLRVDLPAGSRYTGYRYEVQERGESFDCRAGEDCPVGACRWPLDPALRRSPEGATVAAAFENRAADRERRAVLTVYYTAVGRR